LSNKNEDSERKSWEESKSESCEEMPMQNYNPCMQCPMMYGGMNMKGNPMMYGGMNMKGNPMMPKYDRAEEEDDDRYGHGHHYYYHHYHHHYYHPYYAHHRDGEE